MQSQHLNISENISVSFLGPAHYWKIPYQGFAWSYLMSSLLPYERIPSCPPHQLSDHRKLGISHESKVWSVYLHPENINTRIHINIVWAGFVWKWKDRNVHPQPGISCTKLGGNLSISSYLVHGSASANWHLHLVTILPSLPIQSGTVMPMYFPFLYQISPPFLHKAKNKTC